MIVGRLLIGTQERAHSSYFCSFSCYWLKALAWPHFSFIFSFTLSCGFNKVLCSLIAVRELQQTPSRWRSWKAFWQKLETWSPTWKKRNTTWGKRWLWYLINSRVRSAERPVLLQFKPCLCPKKISLQFLFMSNIYIHSYTVVFIGNINITHIYSVEIFALEMYFYHKCLLLVK